MSSRRTAKVAEAIRETVSTTVLFGLKDPRVKNVTVIRAEVSADLRNAKIYVSVMGDEKTQSLTMRGLDSARGFLQAKVADRLQTRYTPILRFVLDPGVKLSAQTSAAIREILGDSPADGFAEDSSAGDASHASDSADDDAIDEPDSDPDATEETRGEGSQMFQTPEDADD